LPCLGSPFLIAHQWDFEIRVRAMCWCSLPLVFFLSDRCCAWVHFEYGSFMMYRTRVFNVVKKNGRRTYKGRVTSTLNIVLDYSISIWECHQISIQRRENWISVQLLSNTHLTLSFRSCAREICAILTRHTSHHDGTRRHRSPLLTMIHHEKLVMPLLIHLY